jgi:hypothetical protein
MPRLEEPKPAVLHERNIAPAQLDLEQIGMMRGAHQYRLPLQVDPRLAVLKHALHDVANPPLPESGKPIVPPTDDSLMAILDA